MSRDLALITGCPGVLARSLAEHLLVKHPRVQVMLIVSEGAEEATEAFLESLSPGRRKRVRACPGDTLAVDLGLSGADVKGLLAECTYVFHADVKVEGTRDVLWRRHVKPLRGLLSMAREMPLLKRLTLVSTAFVSGDRTGIIYEEELDRGQDFRTPFEWSMSQAEQVAREMMPWLPITIVRPSAILALARGDEAVDLDLGPRYLLDLMVKLPQEIPLLLPGSSGLPLNLVPLSYVVAGTCALARAPEAVGRTFHLTDPNPLSARRVFEILSDATQRPRPLRAPGVPAMVSRLLSVPMMAPLTRNPRALLNTIRRDVVYNCAGALELLSPLGVLCPSFETYVDRLCAWATAVSLEAVAQGEAHGR